MPAEFRRYGRAWQELHPDWEIKDWSEPELEWIENRSTFQSAANLSAKANIARYEIILREGGVYVDTDFEPLKPITPLIDGASLVVGEEWPGYYSNAFFAAEPGHPTLRYAVDRVAESFGALPDASSPDRTGPGFWTRCVKRSTPVGRAPRVLPRHLLYPYSIDQPHLRHAHFSEAFAVHHWARSWHTPAPRAQALRPLVRRTAHNLRSGWDLARRQWEQLPPSVAVPRRGHHATHIGDGRLMVLAAGRFPIFASSNDLGVTPSLVVDGIYDPGFVSFIRREVNRGDVCIDVGANIGLFTLEMAFAVGRTGVVISFEPNPAVAQLLRDSVYMNQMRGLEAEVRIRGLAVGEQAGSVELLVPARHAGMATVERSGLPDSLREEVDSVVVDQVRLDEDLATMPAIRLLKIDVEGAEHRVLQGMDRILTERRVEMLDLELLDSRAGESWQALEERLREIVARHHPTTFTLSRHGRRIPMSLESAVHSPGLQHFLMDFTQRSEA